MIPGSTANGNGSGTLAERAENLLLRAIATGELPPGARLIVPDLSKRLGVGVTPIRESLVKLASLGLVVAVGQKGFRVPQTSLADIEDITRLRILIEVEALKISMERGGDVWEANILSSLHRLCKFTRRMDLRTDMEEFDRLHKIFHVALISECDSPRMLSLQSTLYDQLQRYRHFGMTLILQEQSEGHTDGYELELRGKAAFESHHRDLADAVLSRQADRAFAELTTHLSLMSRLWRDQGLTVPTGAFP